MEVSGQLHTPAILPTGRNSVLNGKGGWVVSKSQSAHVGEQKNFLPLFEFKSWIVRPAASSLY